MPEHDPSQRPGPSPHRIAVVGAGDMGTRHIIGWQSLGHEVHSVTDVDEQLATAAAEKYGIGTVLSRFTDAVTDPDIDIVSVCLPLRFHAPVTVAAARAGKHILCEKPMARDLREADEMEAAVRAAGVTCAIGYQRNYATGTDLLRTWAQEGRFGHPMIYTYDLLAQIRPKVAMHDRDGNNGPLTDGACHHYLKFQTVFRSRPSTVYAQGRIFALGRAELTMHRHLAIDSGVVTITYESGDVATLTASWGLAPGTNMPQAPDRILGPDGCVVGDVHRELVFHDGAELETTELPTENLHAAEMADLVAAIDSGGEPRHSLRDGRQMLILTRAIEQSIHTGQPVDVDYDQ